MVYYVEDGRRCGIRVGKNIEEVKRIEERERGTDNPAKITRATRDNILWVKGMGGRVPQEALDFLKTSKTD